MLAPGVWLKQARPIFYTGRTVIREPGLPDQLADVVIERAAFERWMDARRKEGGRLRARPCCTRRASSSAHTSVRTITALYQRPKL